MANLCSHITACVCADARFCRSDWEVGKIVEIMKICEFSWKSEGKKRISMKKEETIEHQFGMYFHDFEKFPNFPATGNLASTPPSYVRAKANLHLPFRSESPRLLTRSEQQRSTSSRSRRLPQEHLTGKRHKISVTPLQRLKSQLLYQITINVSTMNTR